jgi:hypothetical protein
LNLQRALASDTLDAEVVEHLLLHSTMSKLTGGIRNWSTIRRRGITKFSMETTHQGLNTKRYLTDVKPTDLSGPLDHTMLTVSFGPKADPGDFTLHHVYRVEPRELRGLPFNQYPVGYDLYNYRVSSETVEHHRTLFYYKPTGRWIEGPLHDKDHSVVVTPNRWYNVTPPSVASAATSFTETYCRRSWVSWIWQINRHLGMQFGERYDWYVLIGFEELPKLQVFVDAHQVRSLFEIKKVKDPIEGRKRLVHWVANHRRRKPTSPAPDAANQEEWIKVCEHLRGCYEFEWKGLNCWLIPSQFDRDKLPAHTKHAEIWK